MSLLLNSTTAKTSWNFDPRTLPDCDIWFDAADTSTLTLDGTTVKAWANKGTISMNAIQDTGTCTSGSTVNGLNYIACPVSAFLAFTCPITAQSRSWFVVARCTTQFNVSTAPQYWGPIGQTVGNGQDSLGWTRASNTAYTAGSGPSGIATAIATATLPNPTNTLHVFGMVYNNVTLTNNRITLNGTSYTLTANAALSSYATGSIKYTINTGFYNTGSDICEIIHYNRAVSVVEQKAIEGYLMWKWGLKTPNESLFVPTSISGCLLWHDSDVNFSDATSRATSFTFTSGNTIATWLDKSGNGRTSTAVSGPVLAQNIQNGKCAVSFNGTNQYFNNPLSLLAAQSNTVFAVNRVNAAKNHIVISINGTTGTVNKLSMYIQPGYNYLYTGGTGTGGNTGLVVPVNTFAINAFYWNGVGSPRYTQMNTNGHYIAPATSGTVSSLAVGGTAIIGAEGATKQNFINGNIAEIIVYDGLLTNAQRNLVERYLSVKWNIPLVNACLLGHPNQFIPSIQQQFNPTDVPGCTVWLDGADTSTMTVSGSLVSQWNDKSGNGTNAVQATSANQPTLESGGGLTFGGVSTYLQVSNPSIRPAQLFVVAKATAVGGVLLQKGYTAGTDLEFSLKHTATDIQALYNLTTGTTGTANYGGGVELTTVVLYDAIWDGTTIMLYVNGTPQATATLSGSQKVAASGATDLRIGADFSSSSNTSTPTAGTLWTGTIYEIICYNSPITVGDRQRVEGYLARKWGIQQTLPKSAPAYFGVPVPASFVLANTPTTISGLRAWYDASDTASITTSSGLVTQWNDKSGNALHMTPRSTYGTAKVATGFQNGLSVLNCSGTTFYEATATNSAVYPLDAYIVIALKPPITRCDVFSITSQSSDNFNSLTFSEYTSLRWHNGSDFFYRTPNTVSPTNETSTNFLLMNWSLANNKYIIRRNGTQLSSTASYTFSLTAGSRFQIGFRDRGTPPDTVLNAYIAEIVVYSGQLSLADRITIETYLSSKWDLRSSLPSSHPNYAVTPTTDIINFNPASVPGCSLWLDASDRSSINSGVTISPGGTVTAWADKSGNGVSLTVGGTPTWNYSLNRLPGITTTTGRFTGTLTSGLVGFRYTAFIVTQYNSNPTAGYPCVAIGNATTASTRFIRCVDWATTLRAASFPPTALATITAPGISTPFLWTSAYNGNTALIARLNSGSTTATAIPDATAETATAVNIGCETITTFGTTNTWPGVISEVILYNSVLPPTIIRNIEAYLSRKWGLSQIALLDNRFINMGTIPNTPRFLPPTIDNLAVWVDGSDSSTITISSGKVVSWRDKSPNLLVFNQLTVATQPTVISSITNGLDAISFTSSQALTSLTNLTLGPAQSWFVVFYPTTASNYFFIEHGPNTNSTPGSFLYGQNNDIAAFNRTSVRYVYDSVSGRGTSPFSINNWYVVGFVNNNLTTAVTDVYWSINGTQRTTAYNTNNNVLTGDATNLLYINSQSRVPATNYTAEIIIYNRALTVPEAKRVEGYLAWKWGLVGSLPSTHPYKKLNP